MDRQYYLDLASSGLRMPIGADLVLREEADSEEIILDGNRLGAVVATAAVRYKTPLAVPLMDLMIEKTALCEMLGIPAKEMPTWHFKECPTVDDFTRVEENLDGPFTPRLKATVDAVQYVAENTDLVPCGMAIGPFSLMTKLIADPIGPVYMAGTGVTANEDPEVRTMELALELGLRVIIRNIIAQIDAGAKAIVIAEPAANRVYISPKQLDKGSDIFERYVMVWNRRVKALLDQRGIDLFFHCCGELTNSMVAYFASLDPAILSLGSSRILWEDAKLVPNNVVLYGNLPSKQFYSDDLISVDGVRSKASELTAKMREIDHPFILGTECDVLSVPGCHDSICSKVQAFVDDRDA